MQRDEFVGSEMMKIKTRAMNDRLSGVRQFHVMMVLSALWQESGG
jgi:hypothetical protein